MSKDELASLLNRGKIQESMNNDFFSAILSCYLGDIPKQKAYLRDVFSQLGLGELLKVTPLVSKIEARLKEILPRGKDAAEIVGSTIIVDQTLLVIQEYLKHHGPELKGQAQVKLTGGAAGNSQEELDSLLQKGTLYEKLLVVCQLMSDTVNTRESSKLITAATSHHKQLALP